jgi:molybdenum cofactor biosynthesis enzyme MoaA
MVDLSPVTTLTHELELTISQDAEYMKKLGAILKQLEMAIPSAIIPAQDRADLDTGLEEINISFGSINEDVMSILIDTNKVLDSLEEIDRLLHPEDWNDEEDDE